MTANISRRQVLAAGAAVASSAALTAAGIGAGLAAAGAQPTRRRPKTKPTVVLVHGGYADSSCWNDVIRGLQREG